MAKTSGWVAASKGSDKHGDKRVSGDALFKDTQAQKQARRASRKMSVTYRTPVTVERATPKVAGPLHVDEIPAKREAQRIVVDGPRNERQQCAKCEKHGHHDMGHIHTMIAGR